MALDGASGCYVLDRIKRRLDCARACARGVGELAFRGAETENVYRKSGNSITIPGFLENRFGDHTKLLRLFSGLVILVFFTFYVSSGMVSGGVLFNSILGLNYHTGLWVVTGVVVAYTLFGAFWR